MTDNQQLPESDQDLLLARSYGRVLEEGRDEKQIPDPLIRLLSTTRNYMNRAENDVEVRGAENVWTALESSVSAGHKKTETGIYHLLPAMRWISAAAAVLLIAAASLFYFYMREAAPVLIAASGTEITSVQFADGSSAVLRPNSSLYLIEESGTHHIYRISGEALFDVMTNPARNFTVEADNGRVTVLGTRFTVRDYGRETSVFLFEGRVRLETNDRSRFVTLSPGQASVIDSEMRISDPFTVSEEEITGWTENRLVFSNREAESIFRELEYHFNITIIAPEMINREIMGGSIGLYSADQSLNDLASVLGGYFEISADSVYRFRAID